MIKLKDLICETFEDFLSQMREIVKDLNARADSRYNQISKGGITHTHLANPFEPHSVNRYSSEEGHRQALQDPTYISLKRDAQKAESRLRTLEKKYKKQLNRKN